MPEDSVGFGGAPDDRPDRSARRSPNGHSGQVRAPLLVPAAGSTLATPPAVSERTRRAAFPPLLAASAAGNTADGIVGTVVPLLAVTLTRDPLTIAALTAAALLPWLVVGVPAGVAVDRRDAVALTRVAHWLRTGLVAAAAVLVAVDATRLWMLFAVAVVVGCAEVLVDSGIGVLVPRVVAEGNLQRANGRLWTAEVVANEAGGPLLAGALFAVAAGAPLLLAAALLIVAAASLTVAGRRIGPAQRRPALLPPAVGPVGDPVGLAAALRWLTAHQLLRRLLAATVVLAVAHGLTLSVLVLVVLDTLALSAAVYGVVVAVTLLATAAGALTSARVCARLGERHRFGVLLAVTAGGFTLAGVGATRPGAPLWVLLGLVAAEFAAGVWQVAMVTARQHHVPPAWYGTVTGVSRFAGAGAAPLGVLAGGVLARAGELTDPLLIAAALTAATTAWALARPPVHV